MRHNEHALLAPTNGSVNEYLACTGMTNQHVWGTDVEIMATSSLLETDIYVYMKVGFIYKWEKFSGSILSGYPAKNTGGLYVQNISGVHYDIAQDVACSPTPHSNHGCKRKQQKEQSHSRQAKSVDISQPSKLAKRNHGTDTSKHVSFTLSNTEDIDHTSGDNDTKLTSNNTMNTQSTDYKNVTLDLDPLQSLPVNGVLDDLQTVETKEMEFQNIETNANTSDDSDEDLLKNNKTKTSSFLPHNENSKIEKGAIFSEIGTGKINWPTIEDKPLNEYTFSGLAT